MKIYLIILPLDGGGLRWEWTGCAPPHSLPLPPGEGEMTGNSKHQFQMTKTTFHFVEFRPLEVICDLVLNVFYLVFLLAKISNGSPRTKAASAQRL
jgi:hypothetical protein